MWLGTALKYTRVSPPFPSCMPRPTDFSVKIIGLFAMLVARGNPGGEQGRVRGVGEGVHLQIWHEDDFNLLLGGAIIMNDILGLCVALYSVAGNTKWSWQKKKHCNKWISCRCKHNHPKTQLTNTILNCSNTSYNLTNTILNCSNTPYNFTNTILNCSNTLYSERMNALTPRKETMYKVSDFLLISSSKVLNLKW